MTSTATLQLTGASGRKFAFPVYPLGAPFKAIGGVYVITCATPNQSGTHKVVYVGQTGDMSERFDNHHKADEFTECNANCICVHAEGDEKTRLAIEADLIAAYNPPCNG